MGLCRLFDNLGKGNLLTNAGAGMAEDLIILKELDIKILETGIGVLLRALTIEEAPFDWDTIARTGSVRHDDLVLNAVAGWIIVVGKLSALENLTYG